MKLRNGIILLLIFGAVIITIWLNWPEEKGIARSQNQGKQQAAHCLEGKGEVRAEEGFCAPNFTLNTLDGKKAELYKNNGKPSVVNFWASWCGPCQREMPEFQEAYERYKDKVNFLMVNETETEQDEEAVYDYLRTNNYTFPVLMDRADSGRKTVGMDQYGVLGVPMTYVVAPDGTIMQIHRGEMTKGQIEKMLKEITE
ncbi:TlpA family protein disulfide reductase [Paenactinomyces guangxiensis]|uniref:Redoxin domain-containing protein n=1 Tax=Paenactinomyces guangxiensis TaxID=1490290 RepID=A0A7W1WQV0_9BACL|nr:redoxin domain-containing protein [Paenactinomyces guangxiensis]MBA4494278.1 redoxin domain-containing protein [Paenactinomyces guangxiensis]MBH8590772.1 redoxin domain-containing protein [Paenactinomyces guangxiensis]